MLWHSDRRLYLCTDYLDMKLREHLQTGPCAHDLPNVKVTPLLARWFGALLPLYKFTLAVVCYTQRKPRSPLQQKSIWQVLNFQVLPDAPSQPIPINFPLCLQLGPTQRNGCVQLYLYQMLKAVSYAHARGIVHGNLRLGDIYVDRASDTARVADFGLAHCLDRILGRPRKARSIRCH